MKTRIAVSLPDDLVEAMDRLVGRTGGSRSEIVRCAVAAYLYREACEHDAEAYDSTPLCDAELALVDDPGTWTPTPPW